MRVEADEVSADIDGVRIVSAVSLSAPDGSIVGLVGPNGSGKSTMLRTVYRVLRPAAGTVRIGDRSVWGITAREAARCIAVLTQDGMSDFDFTVTEIVSLGRVPHKGLLDRSDANDQSVIETALQRASAAHLSGRRFATLSGGERQKVLLARALAQEPKVLVLDEPTNHLDIAAQLDLLELVRSLGVTVLTALHDLNLAATYCDQIVVLANGTVVASGPPADVLSPDLLRDVFSVEAHCGVHPITGRPLLAFAPARQRAGASTMTSQTPATRNQ